MPNPNPVQTPEFKAHIKPKYQAADLAAKPICVRFSVEHDQALRQMSDRSEFIRAAVAEKLAKLER